MSLKFKVFSRRMYSSGLSTLRFSAGKRNENWREFYTFITPSHVTTELADQEEEASEVDE